MADVSNWLELVVMALGVGFGLLFAAAARRINSLLGEQVKQEQLRSVLLRLNDAVFDAVGEIKQTVVDDLKESARDGKLSSEEVCRVAEQAKRKALEHLGSDFAGQATLLLGLKESGLDKLVASKVERAVATLKVPGNGVRGGQG